MLCDESGEILKEAVYRISFPSIFNDECSNTVRDPKRNNKITPAL
jgi:hypothetical protein